MKTFFNLPSLTFKISLTSSSKRFVLLNGFYISTPVGNYNPDWAIAFNKGTVKHIFFIAETKGTMDSLNLKPIEQAKIACAKKLFNNLSSADVVYHEVNSYQHLLDIMDKL